MGNTFTSKFGLPGQRQRILPGEHQQTWILSQLLETWALEPQNLEYPGLKRSHKDRWCPSSTSCAGHDAAMSPPQSLLRQEECQICHGHPWLCYVKSLQSSSELLSGAKVSLQCPQTCSAPPPRQDWELLCNCCPAAALAAAGGRTGCAGSGQGRLPRPES